MDPSPANFTVRYSPEDGQYVATAEEYPSASWLANTPLDALSGLVVLVTGVPVADSVAAALAPTVIADLLIAHREDRWATRDDGTDYGPGCACGWTGENDGTRGGYTEQHVAHVAAAVSTQLAAGLAAGLNSTKRPTE